MIVVHVRGPQLAEVDYQDSKGRRRYLHFEGLAECVVSHASSEFDNMAATKLSFIRNFGICFLHCSSSSEAVTA